MRRVLVALVALFISFVAAQDEAAAATVAAAPVADSAAVSNITKRDNDNSIVTINGERKFSVYVGPAQGMRRVLVQEVSGGEDLIGPDQTRDGFAAYDDNSVVPLERENRIFVPKILFGPEPTTTTRRTTTTTSTTPRPPPPTAPPRPIAPIQPQQPFFPPRPQQPFPQQPQPVFTRPPPLQPPQISFQNQQQFQQFRPQQPLQPFAPQPPVTAAPRPFQPPSRPQDATGLRTGVCGMSIFYISTPIVSKSRLVFTHFAVAVSVDQCARTCHEFNCAIAHFEPRTGHCQFNPGTSFAIRQGQCPAWPSLHYRNNVVASESIRIFCVACQKPRRRTTNRSRAQRGRRGRGRRNRQRRVLQNEKRVGIFQQDTAPAAAPADSTPAAGNPVIHGVLLHQPQSQALGLSQASFLSYSQNPIVPVALGVRTFQNDMEQLAVSPIETELAEDVADAPLAHARQAEA